MTGAFLAVKYIHILLAIVAVGSNMTYGIWIGRAAANPAHLEFALRGIKVIDDRVANPAYGLLLVTGLLMVVIAHDTIAGTFWLETAIGLWLLLVIVGAAAFTPTLRKQIAALAESGPTSPDYQRLASRATVLGILLGVIVIAIVFLMVVKPTF
jgi:uncharacterized membrane protein